MRSKSFSTAGQLGNPLEIAVHKGLFLRPRPSLYAPLRGNRIHNLVEVLAVNQDDWPPLLCETRKATGLVFCKSLLELSARCPSIVGAIRTPKYVKPGTHIYAPRPSRRPAAPASSGRGLPN